MSNCWYRLSGIFLRRVTDRFISSHRAAWMGPGFERRLTLMVTAIKNGTGVQIPGRSLPELESWSMRELSAGCTAAAEPEGRQPLGVWEAFVQLRLPTGLQDFVSKALWRKLEVRARMLMCHPAATAVCALCGAGEDHHHALKTCPFLEGGVALARVS